MEPPTPGLPELQQPPEVPDPDTDTLTDPTIDEPTPVIPEQVPRATPIDPVTFEPFEE